MLFAVGRVIDGGLPRKVTRVDAAKIAVATRVRRLEPLWRITVYQCANVARSDVVVAADAYDAIPIIIPSERPSQAIVAAKGQRCFFDESARRAWGCHPGVRIAMLPPAPVMTLAPATPDAWLATIRNRT
ncbi:MAG: hypothetical protein E5X94_00555 [Mesorhizobium sp.]|nr:MAG: hypothetical protein E5X94_00555 [Mesorhizobium sp.]